MEPSSVQHNPQIVYSNAQDIAYLLALQTVDFTQRKSAGGAFGQGREAVVKYFPEVVALGQLGWCCVPLIWRVIVIPMTLPGFGSLKEFAVLRTFVRLIAQWSLTNRAPKMIDNLVL
jgi:hypothetical protein